MKKIIIVITVLLFSTASGWAQSSHKEVSPPDGMSKVDAYSLFYNSFASNDYKNALHFGRWILQGLPRSIKGYNQFDLSTNLDRFITIYTNFADKTDDPSLKTAYLDSADDVYDTAFSTFSKDEIDYYQWHINRGRLYQQHQDFIDSAKAKATAQYEKAFELKPQKMAKQDNGYYVRVLLQNLVSKDTDTTKKQALSIIKKVKDSASDDLKKYFDEVRGKLYNSPKERIAYLQQKVKKNPNDTTSITQLRGLYMQQGMTDKAQNLNKKLYQLDPNYQNTIALANTAIQNADYSEAIKYLSEAQDKTNDADKLKSIYLNLANAYLNQDQLRRSRTYARKAMHEDPQWGQPYLLIANIYSHVVNKCSSGRDLNRNDRAVYWLIIDYLNKAKRVDSSVRSTANSRLHSYRPYTPTDEDIFFKNSWKKGHKIKIDGSLNKCYAWINESTTVR